MKVSSITSILLLLSPVVSSRDVPRGELAALDDNSSPEAIPDVSELEKRRGGGGGGHRSSSSGGRGSSSSSSGSSSGGSKGSSSGSKGSSRGSSSSSKSSSSNAGGTTKSGSGTSRSYGGGTYYAGGATTPFAAGGRTASGILPYVLLGSALGFAAGSAWHDHSAYAYPYNMSYNYHQPMAANHNEGTAGNYSMNVVCYCDQYSECGCNDNNNSTYLAEVIGDPPHNSSVVTITQNGTNETAYINGTLANGTTAADPNASSASSVLAMRTAWPVVALVSAMMYAV